MQLPTLLTAPRDGRAANVLDKKKVINTAPQMVLAKILEAL